MRQVALDRSGQVRPAGPGLGNRDRPAAIGRSAEEGDRGWKEERGFELHGRRQIVR